jgi:hypothetical protein
MLMKTISEIEEAIKELPRDEYGKLRRWIEDYELEQDLVASSAQVAAMLDEEDGGEDQLVDNEAG